MKRIAFVWCISLGMIMHGYALEKHTLENDIYRVTVVSKRNTVKTVRIEREGVAREVRPELTVWYMADDPGYSRGTLDVGNTPVAVWRKKGEKPVRNIWQVGVPVCAQAVSASKSGRSIRFSFPHGQQFQVALVLSLAPGATEPVFSWELEALADGWYSVAFTGLKEKQPETLDFLYQPLVWSWKRFPAEPVLTPEAFATTASVFTNSRQLTEGLVVSPEEIPYRFATFDNSLFGLALHGDDGQAKPVIFAPVLGGHGSALKAGQQTSFSCIYFIKNGEWEAGVQYLYKDILQYRSERRNATVSLNQTFENMVDYAMNDFYAGWVEDLKGADYRFDVPGTVKNVSALHPLSVALTTGSPDIYRRRAVPMIAYLMSREKYLYAISEEIMQQNPSHFLKGPCMEISELVSLDLMTGRRNPAFSKETDRVFGKVRQLNLVTETGGETWQDYLAKYRMNRTDDLLQHAVTLADAYLEHFVSNYPKDFTSSAGLKDRQASFVTDYTNRWYDLLELYEETGYERYLKAAETGARQMLLWMRSNPMAPDSVIRVNEGNRVAGVFPGRRFKPNSYDFQEYNTATEIQEQEIEAWRTSLVGLPPEAPSTYRYGPVMLTHHAAWMLRLARLTGDDTFRDAAYNAVLGRYANFPGYYFTSFATNVYQQQDYPLHPYLDVKYNAIFYNHIWPHIALLQDFLISDAYLRSDGRVDFPSAYSFGYAFLTSKVYGHTPGKVFGHEGVYPWLPKRPFTRIDPMLNYVLGRSGTDTYAVLMNTSDQLVSAPLVFNQDVVKWHTGREYRVELYQGDTVASSRMKNGVFSVEVPANGLTVVRIIGLKNDVALQVDCATADNIQQGYFRQQVDGAGTITGMLIGIADDYTEAFVYTDATEKQIQQVELQYRQGNGTWETLTDQGYPFEFSWRVDMSKDLWVRLKATGVNGKITETESFQLK